MTEVRKMLLKWVETRCWGAARTQMLLPDRGTAVTAPSSISEEAEGDSDMAVGVRGETEHLLPILCTWEWLWTNKDTQSLCVVPRQASYQSQSCPSCQRRAWIRPSGQRCPRNTQSGCSSSVWPEWRRWQTHCPESSPAARRTAERWGYFGAHLPIHRR